jgi:hypothetical protein
MVGKTHVILKGNMVWRQFCCSLNQTKDSYNSGTYLSPVTRCETEQILSGLYYVIRLIILHTTKQILTFMYMLELYWKFYQNIYPRVFFSTSSNFFFLNFIPAKNLKIPQFCSFSSYFFLLRGPIPTFVFIYHYICLFSWRYNPLWFYFPQPGSGF